jgi:hypothetical protein
MLKKVGLRLRKQAPLGYESTMERPHELYLRPPFIASLVVTAAVLIWKELHPFFGFRDSQGFARSSL